MFDEDVAIFLTFGYENGGAVFYGIEDERKLVRQRGNALKVVDVAAFSVWAALGERFWAVTYGLVDEFSVWIDVIVNGFDFAGGLDGFSCAEVGSSDAQFGANVIDVATGVAFQEYFVVFDADGERSRFVVV